MIKCFFYDIEMEKYNCNRNVIFKKKDFVYIKEKLFIVFYEFILRSYFGKIVFILYYLGFILCCSYIVMDCCLDLCFVSC